MIKLFDTVDLATIDAGMLPDGYVTIPIGESTSSFKSFNDSNAVRVYTQDMVVDRDHSFLATFSLDANKAYQIGMTLAGGGTFAVVTNIGVRSLSIGDTELFSAVDNDVFDDGRPVAFYLKAADSDTNVVFSVGDGPEGVQCGFRVYRVYSLSELYTLSSDFRITTSPDNTTRIGVKLNFGDQYAVSGANTAASNGSYFGYTRYRAVGFRNLTDNAVTYSSSYTADLPDYNVVNGVLMNTDNVNNGKPYSLWLFQGMNSDRAEMIHEIMITNASDDVVQNELHFSPHIIEAGVREEGRYQWQKYVKPVIKTVASKIGDPVDVSDGAFTDDRELMTYYGQDPLQFTISYNSRITESYSIPGGYTHNFEMCAVTDTDMNTVAIYYNRDQCVEFTTNDGGVTYASSQAIQNQYQLIVSNGLYIMIDPDGDAYGFTIITGKLLVVRKASGVDYDCSYDNNGLLTRVASTTGQTFDFTYDSIGRLLTVTNIAKQTTTFNYDGVVLSSIELPTRELFVPHYVDGKYNLIDSLTYAGDTFVMNKYDDDRRVVSQHNEVETESTQFDYSVQNQVTVTNSNATKTVLTFDDNGNLVQRVDPSGAKISCLYDNGVQTELVTQFGTGTYDQYGRLIKFVTNTDVTTQYAYDGVSNRITEVLFNDNVARTVQYDDGLPVLLTDKDGNQTTITYNEYGRVLSVTSPADTVTYTYDSMQYLTGTVKNGVADNTFENSVLGYPIMVTLPDASTIKYTHDLNGNLLTMTYSDGRVITNQYDAFSRRIKSVDQNGVTVDSNYLIDGHPYQVQQAGHMWQYGFLNTGVLDDVQYDGTQVARYGYYADTGLLNYLVDQYNNVTGYYYDQDGALLHVLTGDGVNGYGYTLNADKLISQLHVGDEQNSAFCDIVYDNLNRVSQYVYANGLTVTYSYNRQDQVTGLVAKFGDTVLLEQTFEYAIASDDVVSVNGTAVYSYDNRHQLGAGTSEGIVTIYGYDKLGNATTGLVTAFDTDALGNVDRILTQQYQYDDLNRLTSTGAKYDAFGRLHVLNGVTFQYDFLGRLFADSTGKYYIWGPQGVIGYYYADARSAVYSYVFDQRGNVVMIVAPDGMVFARYAYSDYNQVKVVSGDADNVLLASGQYGCITDTKNADLIWLSSRWYNATIGRFMTLDTYFVDVTSVLSMNRYAYTLNNPLSYADPSGRGVNWVNHHIFRDFHWLPKSVRNTVGPIIDGVVIIGIGAAFVSGVGEAGSVAVAIADGVVYVTGTITTSYYLLDGDFRSLVTGKLFDHFGDVLGETSLRGLGGLYAFFTSNL